MAKKKKKISVSVIILTLCLSLLAIVRITKNKNTNVPVISPRTELTSPSPSQNTPSDKPLQKGVFIPYWAQSANDPEKYTSQYYFGIAPTITGEIANDPGYTNMSTMDSLSEKNKYVVLRLLDSSVSEAILSSPSVQKKLIDGVKTILLDNGFTGVVIDLEVPFSLQSDKEDKITQFVQTMCTDIHVDYKSCDMLIYGDSQFRKRPYNLKKLGEITDKILVMSYDFHKAGGEPGPNFPLSRQFMNTDGSEMNYGYDFKQMVAHFSSLIPKYKLEMVFGMYGYDWTLNDQGEPLKAASALSLKEIALKIKKEHLKVMSNNDKEKYIQYTDTEGRPHIIWYEDEESSQIKTTYLLERGIYQVSFWAQSYF